MNRQLAIERGSCWTHFAAPDFKNTVGRPGPTRRPQRPSDHSQRQIHNQHKSFFPLKKKNLTLINFLPLPPPTAHKMSFRLSWERKKRRYARRKAKRHAKRNLAALSKPAKPAPAPAPAPVPAANPTTPPGTTTTTTTTTPNKPASQTLARRTAHENHKLRARVRLLEKHVARFNAHETHLAGVLAQLAAARTQIRELSAAMDHVLGQAPHYGRWFDKVCCLWESTGLAVLHDEDVWC